MGVIKLTNEEMLQEEESRKEKIRQRQREDEWTKNMAKMDLLRDAIKSFDIIQSSFYSYRKDDEMKAVDSGIRYFFALMKQHGITYEDGVYYLTAKSFHSDVEEKVVFYK